MLKFSKVAIDIFIDRIWNQNVIAFLFLSTVSLQLSAQHGFKTLNLDSLRNDINIAYQNGDYDSVIEKEKKLAFQFQVRKDHSQALSSFERVALLADSLGNDSLYYTALYGKAKCHYRLKDNFRCDSLCNLIIDSPNVPAIPKGSAYQFSADLYDQNGKYIKAKRSYHLAIENYKIVNDSFRIPIVLRKIGSICRNQGDPANALKYFQEACKYYRPNSRGYDMIINIYNSINNLFYEHNNYSQALEYSERILKLSKDLKSESNRQFYLALHAKNLAALKRNEEADSLYTSIYNFCITENPSNRLTLMQGYLRYCLSIHDLDRAKIVIDSIDIELFDIMSNVQVHSILTSKINLVEDRCKYFYLTQQFSDLNIELHRLKELMQGNDDLNLIHVYHRYKYAYEKAMGNNTKALENFEKTSIIEDSLYKLDQLLLIQDSEMRFQKAEQDNKIILLSSENELSKLKLQASKRRNWIFGLGLLSFTILSLSLLWLYRKIKKKNEIIQEADNEKGVLLQEIHHRVKNNLQVISSLLALQGKYITDDHALDALKQGQDRVQSMALIHQDLYQSDNLKGVNTQDYFEQVVDNLFDSYNISEDDIELELDVQSIMLDVDTMIPLGLVINELVSNSLKHAFVNETNGKIKVKLTEENGMLTLEVADNGKGIQSLEEIEGKSFGYELITAFAKKLKAEIVIDSEDGFTIKLIIRNYKLAA